MKREVEYLHRSVLEKSYDFHRFLINLDQLSRVNYVCLPSTLQELIEGK